MFSWNILLGLQYSAEWSKGDTDEYCLLGDQDNNIEKVTVGGSHACYMISHLFFTKEFSDAYKKILVEEYKNDDIRQGYWEDVYIKHLTNLPPMKIRKFRPGIINEFDSLEELRKFDKSYVDDTRSVVMKRLCRRLGCKEEQITEIKKHNKDGYKYCFSFHLDQQRIFYSNNLDSVSD